MKTSTETEIQNPFSSVSHMCEKLGLADSKFALGWRLTNAVQGEIQALPRSRGRVVATDGMICIIITEDNKVVFGHYDWFNADKEEDMEDLPKKKSGRKPKVLQEFLA